MELFPRTDAPSIDMVLKNKDTLKEGDLLEATCGAVGNPNIVALRFQYIYIYIYVKLIYNIYIYVTACVAQWLRRQTHKQ